MKYLRLVIDTAVIKVERPIAGVNPDGDWPHCGSGGLKGFFASFRDVDVPWKDDVIIIHVPSPYSVDFS